MWIGLVNFSFTFVVGVGFFEAGELLFHHFLFPPFLQKLVKKLEPLEDNRSERLPTTTNMEGKQIIITFLTKSVF